MPRTTRQILVLLAAAAAVLAACGDDDDGATSTTDPAGAGEDAAEEQAAAPAEDAGAGSDAGGGDGTVTVDGVTFTFDPSEICVFSPDNPEEFSMVGPGTDPDGEPVHVAAIGPNQLVVQLGGDSGMATGPRYEYNAGYTGGDAMRLPGLEVDGTTVRATPEMVRLEESGNDHELVGSATFEASC